MFLVVRVSVTLLPLRLCVNPFAVNSSVADSSAFGAVRTRVLEIRIRPNFTPPAIRAACCGQGNRLFVNIQDWRFAYVPRAAYKRQAA
jgi:hypothetical protein